MSNTEFNSFIALLGGVLLLLGVASGLIRNRWSMSEPVIALGIGVIVGPLLGLFSLEQLGGSMVVLEQVARVTLGIALMDVALTLPHGYPLRQWKTMAFFVGLVLPLMWLAGSLVAGISLGLAVFPAMLVGAALAPTDPVIAGTVATGKLAEAHIPARLRYALLSESGGNDALALPFVLLALTFMTGNHQSPWLHWLTNVVLWEVLGAVVIGLVAGWLAGRVLTWAEASEHTERSSLLSVSMALVLLLLGASKLIKADGLLAVFLAGLVLSHYLRGELEEQKNLVHQTLLRFFELPVFLVLGISLPWQAWLQLGWPAALMVAAVLLLRRLPILLALRFLAPALHARRDALFVGWFGPMGVATLYYAAFAAGEYGQHLPWQIGTLVVTASVLVHGATAVGATRMYGRAA